MTMQQIAMFFVFLLANLTYYIKLDVHDCAVP